MNLVLVGCVHKRARVCVCGSPPTGTVVAGSVPVSRDVRGGARTVCCCGSVPDIRVEDVLPQGACPFVRLSRVLLATTGSLYLTQEG